MKGLLSRKKTREDLASDARTSNDVAPPELPASAASKKRWGRKKPEPEQKKEVDLSQALPTEDTFRQSLMLNSLMGRFSMLREADDPNSKIGKASDDSVLMPMNTIHEVSSIRSFRPPFAATGRSGSFHNDGYATDDDSSMNGSIMSRSRPAEGNNVVFGGRQKIYKIPVGDAGSVNNMGSNEPRGMRGRALYEDDDVVLSSFQKMREKDRLAQRDRKLADMEKEMMSDHAAKDGLSSPAISYDEKRETDSSCNSGPPSMMSGSTAPTSSIVSQNGYATPVHVPSAVPTGVQRSNSRRLYEHGLDQYMTEQQSAALSRMNSISRKASARGRPSQPLGQSRSATNLKESYNRAPSAQSSGNASPTHRHGDKLTTFEPARDLRSAGPASGGTSPLSPNFGLNGEVENPLAQAVSASDRGKATAMGAFNRPRQQFDQDQYLARQQSLLQQRKTSRSPRPTPRAVQNAESRRPSGEGRRPFYPRPSFDKPPRSRAGTNRSDRSWSASSGAQNAAMNSSIANSPSDSSPTPDSPTIPGQAELTSPESMVPLDAQKTNQSIPNDLTRPGINTQIAIPPVIDDEDVPSSAKISFERGTSDDVPAPLLSPKSQPDLSKHPALRADATSSPSPTLGNHHHDAATAATSGQNAQSDANIPAIGVDESHAIGVAQTTDDNHALGKMVAHLRQPSNVSSHYPDDEDEKRRSRMPDPTEPVPSMYSDRANPWDLEQIHAIRRDGMTKETPALAASPNPSVSPAAQQEQYTTLGPRPNDAAAWVDQIRSQQNQHARGASTETEQERRAFNEELLQRRKEIQENLKIKAARTSRSPSPGGTNVSAKANLFENSLKPFGILRTKSSKDSVKKPEDQQSNQGKGPKRFGMGGQNNGPASKRPDEPRGRIRGPEPMVNGPPVGRTLHMRMPKNPDQQTVGGPAPRPSRDMPSSARPAYPPKATRPGYESTRRTPPDSGRSSSSQEARHGDRGHGYHNGRDRVGSPQDVHRRDFPSQFSSANSSGRPSMEQSNRLRSDSGASRKMPPPRPAMMPNLRTNTAPSRPPGLSNNDISPADPLPKPSHSTNTTPILTPNQSFGNLSSPSIQTMPRGPHGAPGSGVVSPGSGTPYNNASMPNFAGNPNFPPRRDSHDRPALRTPAGQAAAAQARSRRRAPTLTKSDISEPTLEATSYEVLNTIERSNVDVSSTYEPKPRSSSRDTPTPGGERSGASTPNSGVIPGMPMILPTASSPPHGPLPPPPPIPSVNPARKGFKERLGFHRNTSGNRDGASTAPLTPGASSGVTSPSGRSATPTPPTSASPVDDDLLMRPATGKLRIRKASDGSGSGRGRHEAVSAGLVERNESPVSSGGGSGVVGGMI